MTSKVDTGSDLTELVSVSLLGPSLAAEAAARFARRAEMLEDGGEEDMIEIEAWLLL
jgi:hypothetical protein